MIKSLGILALLLSPSAYAFTTDSAIALSSDLKVTGVGFGEKRAADYEALKRCNDAGGIGCSIVIRTESEQESIAVATDSRGHVAAARWSGDPYYSYDTAIGFSILLCSRFNGGHIEDCAFRASGNSSTF